MTGVQYSFGSHCYVKPLYTGRKVPRSAHNVSPEQTGVWGKYFLQDDKQPRSLRQLLKLMLQREWGCVCSMWLWFGTQPSPGERVLCTFRLVGKKNTFRSSLKPNPPPAPSRSYTHAVLNHAAVLNLPHPSLPVGDKLVCCLFFPPKLLIGHLWQSCAAAPGEILLYSVLWVAAGGKHAGAGKSDQSRSDASHKYASPARTPAQLPALLQTLKDIEADEDGRNLTVSVNVTIVWTVFVILLLDLSRFGVWSSWWSALNQS